MCRWCHLPKLTPRYLAWRYWLSEWLLAATFVVLCLGFLHAQSQDYINAQHSEQIRALIETTNRIVARIDRIENRMDYILGALATIIFTQWLNFRQGRQYAKQRRSTDRTDEE